MTEISLIPLLKGEDKGGVKQLLYCRMCDEFKMKFGKGQNIISLKIQNKKPIII